MNSVLTLLMIDVDHFKTLNDSLGHQIGDNYLMLVGSELSRLCRRKVDVPARYGGEEFAIVLPDTTADYANQFAEDVRKAIAAMQLPHLASSIAPILTVSVGVATASRDRCCTPEALVAAADQALYAAKRGGRNRVSVFQPEADSEECSSPPVEARS
jgi:diguanylate cyclase (GGDEF)-like protein